MTEGYNKGHLLDSQQYASDIRSIFYEFIAEKDISVDEMQEYFEDNGYGFIFVSEKEPIEASSSQTSKFKYGNELFEVYGTGDEFLHDDINELNSVIVTSTSPLYFKQIA